MNMIYLFHLGENDLFKEARKVRRNFLLENENLEIDKLCYQRTGTLVGYHHSRTLNTIFRAAFNLDREEILYN